MDNMIEKKNCYTYGWYEMFTNCENTRRRQSNTSIINLFDEL